MALCFFAWTSTNICNLLFGSHRPHLFFCFLPNHIYFNSYSYPHWFLQRLLGHTLQQYKADEGENAPPLILFGRNNRIDGAEVLSKTLMRYWQSEDIPVMIGDFLNRITADMPPAIYRPSESQVNLVATDIWEQWKEQKLENLSATFGKFNYLFQILPPLGKKSVIVIGRMPWHIIYTLSRRLRIIHRFSK